MNAQGEIDGPLRTIDDVIDLYLRVGAAHYGEDVSQTEHALQCAALARRAKVANELVAAALLHDIGHLVHLEAHGGAVDVNVVDDTHEAVGARVLARLFPPSVTAPVAMHVEAKRYRCATDPAYFARLSAASKRSLELQGGPLDRHQIATFAQHPAANDALLLRSWDDDGKITGLELGTIDDYRSVLQLVAR